MAYFKLTLLTPYSIKTSTQNRDFYNSIYFEDLITEFNPQLEAYKTTQHHPVFDDLTDVQDEFLIDNKDKTLSVVDEEYHPIDGYTIGNPNYNIKKRKSSTAFSYGEKITLSQNAQKTLSFSMNRFLIRENERLENPFVNLIQAGSQLLLTDQYNNEYFFTVTSIKYTIKETNIIYDYTCQDSFTYQTSRQNQNYFIDNDPTSADFIGPKTADWWIVHKVVPECYLSNYSYIPCSRALYENTNGEFILCDSLQDKTDVKRVIKESHKIGEDNYYTTFAYSCSGQNAASTLIDIASKINMQLKVCEHSKNIEGQRTKYFDRYFWIEPIKNDQRVGLVYSPRRDIQSFDLTHNGQSLTTSLIVTGPIYNDEIITLIPDIPLFFHNYFLRPDWNNIDYSSGMFTQACSGQSFFGDDSFTEEDVKTGTNRFEIDIDRKLIILENNQVVAILLPIFNNNNLFDFHNDLYDHFTFFSDEETEQKTSQIQISYTSIDSQPINITATPKGETWVLAQEKETGEGLEHYNLYYPGQNFTNNIEKDKELYICLIFNIPLEISPNTGLTINYAQAYIKFFRDVSQEELEFATIADKCPWLENKIIDFTYFYKQNIISRREYNELINILYNDLRKVNGKLIYYTQAYYKAIHDKTEMLANLTNQLDTLGAAAQAAVVDSLATTGKVKDISYFEKAYNTVFDTGEQEIMGLLDYNSIISEYFTKYFNAQQRFLKNVYNFRKFFNTENPLHNKALYHYKLTIAQPTWTDVDWSDKNSLPTTFYGFSNNKFISLNNNQYPYIYYNGCTGGEYVDNKFVRKPDDTSSYFYGKPTLALFLNENGRFSPIMVASQDMWTEGLLYRYPNFIGQKAFCTDHSRYNEKQAYLKISIKVPINYDRNSSNYYWHPQGAAESKKRFIASSSTRNYRYTDLNRFIDTSLLYGLYEFSFNKNDIQYSTICRADRIINEGTYENPQYYLYLSQMHQGEWNNSQLEIFSILFDDTNVNFEDTSYKEVPYNVAIKAVFLDETNTYQQIYFNGSTSDKETYSFESEQSFIGLVSASQQDLKDNWIYTHYSLASNVFIKEKPYYEIFSLENFKNSLNTLSSWATLQTFAFVQDDLEEIDLDKEGTKEAYEDEKSLPVNSILKPIADSYYIKYFPITDFYVKTPRYRVSKTEDDNYLFERLNEKNQSFTTYLEYVFNTSEFVTEMINDPYSFTEYKKLNFVNKKNQAQFYRRVINHPNAGLATGLGIAGAGLFIFGPAAPWSIPAFIAIAPSMAGLADEKAESCQHWDTSGVTSRDFYGNSLGANTRFTGYWESNFTGEQVYAVTENSFSLWYDYCLAFEHNVGQESSVLITKIEDWDQYKNNIWEKSSISDGKVILNRISSGTPLYYTLYDQHIGYDLYSLLNRRNWGQQDVTIGNTTITLNPPSVFFLDKSAQALKIDSIVSKNDSIFMLWLGKKDKNIIIYNGEDFKEFLKNPFSTTYYYPLTNNFQKINISTLDWKDKEYLTLEEVISNGGRWKVLGTDDYYIKIKQTKQKLSEGYVVFFRVTDYQSTSLKEYYEYPDNLSKAYPRLFDTTTLSDFNFLKQNDIVKGFYIGIDISKDRVLANIQDKDIGFNMNTSYYTEDGTRIYTIHQLIERNNCVYLHNFVFEKDDIGDNVDNFYVNLSKYQINYGENIILQDEEEKVTYYINSVTETPLDHIYQVQFNLEYQLQEEYPSVISSKEIQINEEEVINIDLLGKFASSISGLSNGTFWHLYHTSINIPVLFSTAASIEAELTGYWNEAYTASKFCEYFFPESWTPTSNQKDNLFSNAIFTIKDEGDIEYNEYTDEWNYKNHKYQAELLNNFLPEVDIIKDNSGQTILKKYQYVFDTSPSHSIEHFANAQYVLEDQDVETTSSTSIIKNNFAIRNAMKILYKITDEQIDSIASKWLLTDIGKTTYYYSEVGGTTWPELVQRHISNGNFTEFDGWYLMALRWLKYHYQNWDLIEYTEAKQNHDAIWNKIYQEFGHIILENTFKSETATSSTELLNEALLQFKDRASPERQYNISVIDTAALENYSGAEIRIGDGIQVKATDYYDQQDLIYDSLTQYLFITDISYTLRDATNFSLTVNDVKYADTVIKRLAKLIK